MDEGGSNAAKALPGAAGAGAAGAAAVAAGETTTTTTTTSSTSPGTATAAATPAPTAAAAAAAAAANAQPTRISPRWTSDENKVVLLALRDYGKNFQVSKWAEIAVEME